MLVTLKEILQSERACAAFNVYGYEDSISIIRAAEAKNRPVILMTNTDAIRFIPIEAVGALLISLAKAAKVPVCVHLDHSKSIDDIKKAIDTGYTSVMYDGSQLDFDENVKNTLTVVKMAHERGVSVEAEIGSVGYSDPAVVAKAEYTNPDEAVLFAQKTGVDALAVSVGTVHRMKTKEAKLDFELLKTIRAMVSTPLVIHGSSGVALDDMKKLVEYGINKINIGTSLRLAFGNTLRKTINDNPAEFDRLKMFVNSMSAVEETVKEYLDIVR